ncbi:hypothetical protein LSPH26S_03827 [Lysinibacillus sphaericus]
MLIIGAGAAGLMSRSPPASAAGACWWSTTPTRSATAAGAAISPTWGRRRRTTVPPHREVRAGALHAVGLHRAGGEAPHRVPREGAGPAVLRRLVQADRAHAAGRMRRRRRHGGGELRRAARAQDAGRFRRAHRARRGACAVAGGRLRRPVDSQHGRQRLRLRTGAAVRPRRAAHARRPGAADPERQARSIAGIWPAWRCPRWRRAWASRVSAPRIAVHPPRHQRPGDPADFLLVATRRRPAHRLAARSRCWRVPARTACGAAAGGTEDRARRHVAEAPGATPVRAMVRQPANRQYREAELEQQHQLQAPAEPPPAAPKATARPRSPWAASTPMASPPAPCSRNSCRVCTSSARWSTWPLARRLQLPVGVGVGAGGGRGGLIPVA